MSGLRDEPRVTIYDVAREVGCAPSTVSRAFSRPGRVSAGTHARVMDAAQRLGYRSGPPESQQRRGLQRRLGIELPDLTNPYFAEVISGMQEAAHELDYLLLLLDSSEDQVRERSGLERALDVVDGVILSGTRLSDSALTQVTKRCPVIVLNRRVAGLDSITPDYETGLRSAIDHLAANGVREILYAAGPGNSWSDGERWRAARIAARERDLSIRRAGPIPPTAAGGERLFEQLRADAAVPHAVIAYNDLIATGIVAAAVRAGLRLPEDLSVIGHDDIPLARLVGHGLTTIVSPKRTQGRLAVERLVRRIEQPSSLQDPVEATLPVKLVVRGSSGARRPR